MTVLPVHRAMNWTAFLNGAARVLDLFGTMSEPVDLVATDDEALQRDLQAIAGDWQSVVHDMNDAIGHQDGSGQATGQAIRKR